MADNAGQGGRPDTDGGASSDVGDVSSLLREVARASSCQPPSPVYLDGVAVAATGDADFVGRALLHFRVVERIGAGGMGVVFRARDERLKRAVALKVLPAAAARDGERRQRFLREARIAAALTHPNVVAVHEIGEIEDCAYIAMELVPGESLRAVLRRGPLPSRDVRALAAQIADGLAAAHAKGIVHRDLKPENVMVTPEGTVKLLDFGLAKPHADPAEDAASIAEADTELQVTVEQARLLGTVHYMSPEQALGEPLSVRSDVFSFGVVLYEMLTGARPFAGETVAKLLVSIARDPAPPLRRRAKDLDPVLEEVTLRCLSKDPQRRFADAGEIAMALSAERPRRRRLRGRAVAAVVSGALIVGAAVAVAAGNRGVPSGAGAIQAGIAGRVPSSGAAAAAASCATGRVLVRAGAYEHADGRVTQVPALWFDATEVTVADYARCEREGKCTPTKEGGRCTVQKLDDACHPVNCVAWGQARAYCESRGMRLPSDDEWEWAARGGSAANRYPWGSDDPRSDDVPQRLCWAEGPGMGGGPCDVGAFPAGDTPDGIHDMAGNVFEWTASEGVPDDAPDNNPSLDHRHVRGGGWYWWGYPYSLRVTSHLTYAIGDALDYVGFRCVKQADATAEGG